MNPLPDRLNLDHLKKQAKQLIRLYRSRDAAAMARFRSALPATAGLGDDDISSQQLRLHDAQSCIAREHGFASWPDLKRYVEVQAVAQKERAVRVLHWAQLIYSGDVSGTVNRANPRVIGWAVSRNVRSSAPCRNFAPGPHASPIRLASASGAS